MRGKKSKNSQCLIFQFDFEEKSLAEFGIEELVNLKEISTAEDRKQSMKKLALSLKASTAELIWLLWVSPNAAEKKVEHIQVICNNLFFNLNQLRKQQALLALEQKIKDDI